jgi:hypothetical protein
MLFFWLRWGPVSILFLEEGEKEEQPEGGDKGLGVVCDGSDGLEPFFHLEGSAFEVGLGAKPEAF